MAVSVGNTLIIDDIQRLVIKQKCLVMIDTVDLNEIYISPICFLMGIDMDLYLFVNAFYNKLCKKLSRGPKLPLQFPNVLFRWYVLQF